MASLESAQLSALGSAVEDLTRQSAELAERLEGPSTGEASMAMYEAERSLRMAARAVERARRSLR